METTMQVQAVNGRIERGCGHRIQGACYLTTGTSPNGLPVEHFLLDPPILVPAHLDVPRRGVTLLERNGVWHVLDHVGSDSYPNVADFVEEVRRYGLSRRAPKKLEWSKLSKDSRIILCHSRAWIENWAEYREKVVHGAGHTCAKDRLEHANGSSGPCITTCWEDVEHGELVAHRAVIRRMPSFSYTAAQAPDGVKGQYREAFFMSLPITSIEVVKDSAGDEHVRGLEATADVKGIPVNLVDC